MTIWKPCFIVVITCQTKLESVTRFLAGLNSNYYLESLSWFLARLNYLIRVLHIKAGPTKFYISNSIFTISNFTSTNIRSAKYYEIGQALRN